MSDFGGYRPGSNMFMMDTDHDYKYDNGYDYDHNYDYDYHHDYDYDITMEK